MPKKEAFIKQHERMLKGKERFSPKERSPHLMQKAMVDNENKDLFPTTSAHQFILLDPHGIVRWKYKDRPKEEIGDIAQLADEFKTIGQQQPCIVRKNKETNMYELIAGERRWNAAKQAGVKLQVIIKALSDTDAALVQIAENENRKDISDYSKGISLAALIDNGVLKQKDLIGKLNKSKQYISAILSFTKIPKEIQESIKDMSRVSGSSAEKIKQLASKGNENINALIAIGERIAKNKMGAQAIEKEVSRILSDKKGSTSNRKVYTKSGRHIFTWREDNNHLPSIHFPKSIGQLISEGNIDIEEMSADILSLIERRLNMVK